MRSLFAVVLLSVLLSCSGGKKMTFTFTDEGKISAYKIFSSGHSPAYDPVSWELKGSDDGKTWSVIDKQENQKFCSRYQENYYSLSFPVQYHTYQIVFDTPASDTLGVEKIEFANVDEMANWRNFKYPEVNFEDLAPETEGSRLYKQLVQDTVAYIRYHALKVAQILYFADSDEMYNIEKINYTLKDYEGVSAKGGGPPEVSIVYSTQHIEKSAAESLAKLDFETRGVLYHELVHAYQQEPKGIGSYSTNKTFWACIEGVADAVRAHAGYFDWNTRKPGGNWMDGYRTTGFFIQWLTTKDPDAIRKFNATARELEVWSFDGAIKSIFGQEHSIEGMWQEYQDFLLKR